MFVISVRQNDFSAPEEQFSRGSRLSETTLQASDLITAKEAYALVTKATGSSILAAAAIKHALICSTIRSFAKVCVDELDVGPVQSFRRRSAAYQIETRRGSSERPIHLSAGFWITKHGTARLYCNWQANRFAHIFAPSQSLIQPDGCAEFLQQPGVRIVVYGVQFLQVEIKRLIARIKSRQQTPSLGEKKRPGRPSKYDWSLMKPLSDAAAQGRLLLCDNIISCNKRPIPQEVVAEEICRLVGCAVDTARPKARELIVLNDKNLDLPTASATVFRQNCGN